MSSRRPGYKPIRPARPEHTTCATPNTDDVAAEGGKVEDEMTKRADDLLRRLGEHLQNIVREEGRRTIVSLVPDRPTEEEIREHNVPHTPPKPWCPYCTLATRHAHPARKDEEKGAGCRSRQGQCTHNLEAAASAADPYRMFVNAG